MLLSISTPSQKQILYILLHLTTLVAKKTHDQFIKYDSTRESNSF